MLNNIQLSPHFSLLELTESATARQRDIANIPPPEAVENLKRLCKGTLEPLRKALGLPVIITSGYRCKELNNIVNRSSKTSQHMLGQAADFYISDDGAMRLRRGSRFNAASPRFKVQDSRFSDLKVQSDQRSMTRLKVQGSLTKVRATQGSMTRFSDQGQSDLKVDDKVQDSKVLGRRELLIMGFRLIILNEDIDYDQLILYPTFIHVSYVSRCKNRRKIIKANGHGSYCTVTREAALCLS